MAVNPKVCFPIWTQKPSHVIEKACLCLSTIIVSLCTCIPCNLSRISKLHLQNNDKKITCYTKVLNTSNQHVMDVWFPRTENVFLRVILLLFPYMTFHISSPCLDMHWTRKNPRQEIPRRFTTRNSLAISVCDISHIKPLPRHALDNRKSSSGNPSSNPPRPNWYSPVGILFYSRTPHKHTNTSKKRHEGMHITRMKNVRLI